MFSDGNDPLKFVQENRERYPAIDVGSEKSFHPPHLNPLPPREERRGEAGREGGEGRGEMAPGFASIALPICQENFSGHAEGAKRLKNLDLLFM
jgi:hypothetical protein